MSVKDKVSHAAEQVESDEENGSSYRDDSAGITDINDEIDDDSDSSSIYENAPEFRADSDEEESEDELDESNYENESVNAQDSEQSARNATASTSPQIAGLSNDDTFLSAPLKTEALDDSQEPLLDTPDEETMRAFQNTGKRSLDESEDDEAADLTGVDDLPILPTSPTPEEPPARELPDSFARDRYATLQGDTMPSAKPSASTTTFEASSRSTVPKRRKVNTFWTSTELDALEKGLARVKQPLWREIKDMFPQELARRTNIQLKDKARTEIKGRQKLGQDLGVYKYVLYPEGQSLDLMAVQMARRRAKNN